MRLRFRDGRWCYRIEPKQRCQQVNAESCKNAWCNLIHIFVKTCEPPEYGCGKTTCHHQDGNAFPYWLAKRKKNK